MQQKGCDEIIIIPNEVSQKEKDNTYVWNLKYDTSESVSMKQKQNQGHREQTGGLQREGSSGRLGLADIRFYIQNG